MCECCTMVKTSELGYTGEPLPNVSGGHIRNSGEARIRYSEYVEHFYLEIVRKTFFNRRKSVITSLKHCLNCGANLWEVWDARKK